MDNNILLGTTVKVFENGVQVIKNMNESIDALSNSLMDSNDKMTNLSQSNKFNKDNIIYIITELENSADKQKEVLNFIIDKVNQLKEDEEVKSEEISQGIENFFACAENINNELNKICSDLNTNKMQMFFKESDSYMENIKSKLEEIDNEYDELLNFGNQIEELSEKVKSIKELDLNPNYIKELKTDIDIASDKQKEILNQYVDAVKNLKKTELKQINKIDTGINEFIVNAKSVNEKLEKISTQLNIDDLKNDLNQIESHGDSIKEKIEIVNDECTELLEIKNQIENIKDNIDKVDEFNINEKMNNLSVVLSNINQFINEFDSNILNLNKELEECKLTDNVEGITNNADILINKFKDVNKEINVILEKIEIISNNEDLLRNKLTDILNNQCNSISDVLDKILFENIRNNNIVEQELNANKLTINIMEEKISNLENKIDILITEKKSLKKQCLDDDFKKQIILSIENTIKQNIAAELKNNKEDKNTKIHMQGLQMESEIPRPVNTNVHSLNIKNEIEHKEISVKQDKDYYKSGEKYYTEGDYEQAFNEYSKCVEKNDNRCIEKIKEIEKIIISKARLGNSQYQFIAGNIEIKKSNLIEAVSWYEISAKNGHKEARKNFLELCTELAQYKPEFMEKLGDVYRKGILEKKDLDKAREYYNKAASHGRFTAKEKLKAYFI